MTVSRVLNRDESMVINPEVRMKIFQTAHELKYISPRNWHALENKKITIDVADWQIFLDLTRVLPKEGRGAQGSVEQGTICPEGLSLLERWLIFIRTQESEVREAMAKGHATLEKANRLMEEFHLDKQERMRYQAAMKYERDYNSEMAWREQKGIEEGIRIGRAEGEALGRMAGKQEATIQTALNMKARALDISLIQEITGLTAEEIAEL